MQHRILSGFYAVNTFFLILWWTHSFQFDQLFILEKSIIESKNRTAYSLGLVKNVDKILNLGFEGLAGARHEQHTGVVITPGP